MCLSTVRCNSKGSIGFLREASRTNVMLSRAKHGMFVYGSAQTVRSFKPRGSFGSSQPAQPVMFQQFLAQMEEQGTMGTSLRLRCAAHNTLTVVSDPEQFKLSSEDGGCQLICGMRQACGHGSVNSRH